MKQVKRLKDEQRYVELSNIIRIGNSAIKQAKEENRNFGIPETFWKNGRIYYVLDNGEITLIRPDIMKQKKS